MPVFLLPQVTEEFWSLGDRELAMGIHISPLCNRKTDTNIPSYQLGFFKFVCNPFFALVADLVSFILRTPP